MTTGSTYSFAIDRALSYARSSFYAVTRRYDEDGDDGSSGVREPRRPIVPVNSGSMALAVA
jgi:hypothetical protein